MTAIVRYTHVVEVEVEDGQTFLLEGLPLPLTISPGFPRELIRGERASLEIVHPVEDET